MAFGKLLGLFDGSGNHRKDSRPSPAAAVHQLKEASDRDALVDVLAKVVAAAGCGIIG
jgi:hypothetical protein